MTRFCSYVSPLQPLRKSVFIIRGPKKVSKIHPRAQTRTCVNWPAPVSAIPPFTWRWQQTVVTQQAKRQDFYHLLNNISDKKHNVNFVRLDQLPVVQWSGRWSWSRPFWGLYQSRIPSSLEKKRSLHRKSHNALQKPGSVDGMTSCFVTTLGSRKKNAGRALGRRRVQM